MDTLFGIILVVFPFLLVGILGPWMAEYCSSRGMVAGVTDRSAHRTPTPQGGGALIIAVFIPLALLAVWLLDMPKKPFLTALLLTTIPIALMGWLDDIRHRPPLVRLCLHLACVAIGVAFLPQLFDIVPLWLEKIILVLAWAWFVNLYNFMDGLDGLNSSQAVFLCVAIMLLVPDLSPVAAILAGATIGFLRMNWNPARLFVGDVGSTSFGFVLGGLLLVGLEWDTWRLVWPLFTVTLVFSADTTYTLFKRIAQGHKPWVPHREFWFHRAQKLGLTHGQVVKRVMALNALLLGIALLGYSADAGALSLMAGLLVVSSAALRIKWVETHNRTNIED